LLSDAGFYQSGQLFCFLPLDRESDLPVHINAPFAVRTERRSLHDEPGSPYGEWNRALFRDPIPRAYLAVLESVAESDPSLDLYFSLWPKLLSTQSASQKETPQSQLLPSFYKLLVEDQCRVFPSSQGSVPIAEARFLDPEFMSKKAGRVAFRVLQTYWNASEWREDVLIDLSQDVAKCFLSSEQHSDFQKQTITEEQFFKQVLFPNIATKDAALTSEDRNILVLHALLSENCNLHALIEKHDCIPCRPDGRLRLPKHLIHPDGLAAPLYADSDGRFPMKASSPDADFTRPEALEQLDKLDMVRDNLSTDEVAERAQSVSTVDQETSLERAHAIVKYVSSSKHTEIVKETYATELKHIPFLPVLQKPEEWVFPWHGDHQGLVEPQNALSEDLQGLAGCVAFIVDESALDMSSQEWDVMELMGVTRQKSNSVKTTNMTSIVVKQLLAVAEHGEEALRQDEARPVVRGICRKIYEDLDCRLNAREDLVKQHNQIMSSLIGSPVVLTDGQFWIGDQLAFGPPYDLGPYLTTLDTDLKTFKKLFLALGVKNRYGMFFTHRFWKI
jgi:sacsin